MKEKISNLEDLNFHPVLHGLSPHDTLNCFYDPTKGIYLREQGNDNPEPPLRLGVNLARLIEMCRRVPGMLPLAKEADSFLIDALNDDETPPPWTIFSDSSERPLQAYSTAKIVMGLGTERLKLLKDDREETALTFLREILVEHIDRIETHPMLRILAYQALNEADALTEEEKARVAHWADQCLYMFEAAVSRNRTAPFHPIYMIQLLAIALHVNTRMIDDRRLRSLIGLMIEQYPVLPEESVSAIVRTSSHALGSSSIDALICLLKFKRSRALMIENILYFQNLLDWLLNNSYLTDEGARLFFTDLYRGTGDCELWYNCAVLELLHIVQESIVEKTRIVTLKELSAESTAESYLWEDIKIGGYKWGESLPDNFLNDARSRISNGDRCRNNGIVLFGPPGTTKTSISETIAKTLGNWPLITLGPAHFLLEGQDRLFARIEHIFSKLVQLPRAVILFDELELLVLERGGEGESDLATWQSALVTNAMLPWFKRLHDWGRNIYIIATNNIERIDGAIRRPGRFDFVLPVGPPSLEEQISLIQGCLEPDSELNPEKMAQILGNRATVGEICQWATDTKTRGLSEEDAITLWMKYFQNNLRISEDDYKLFGNYVRDYTYPADQQ